MTKARALERLRTLGRDGHVVRRGELDHPLFLALRVHFGTLAAARRAAGLAPILPRRKWSFARVLDELRALDRAGVAIRARDIVEAGPPGLLFALYKYVGGIKRACVLCRVPQPERRRGEPRNAWDEDGVVDAIRALHRDGRSLAMSKVDPRLYGAGRRLFGTWREAVETAGFDYDKVRLVREAYTRKEVVALLRKLARERPRMAVHEVARHPYGRAARKVFGSTAKGAAAAGVAGWPVRRWHAPMSRKQVIERLRTRKRSGKQIYMSAVQREDVRLWRSGIAHWGRWPRVLAAARLADDAPPRRRWTKAIILERLRDRKRKGLTLRTAFVQREDPGLVQAASNYFGSYREAAKRVGFDTVRHPWTRERVIAELRRRANGGTRVTNAMAGPALTLAAWKLFGKFSKACRAAGLEVHARR
jgi:hypothetical protein